MAGGSLPSTEMISQKDSREARSPNTPWLNRVAQRSSTHSSALDNAFRFIDGMTKGTAALPFTGAFRKGVEGWKGPGVRSRLRGGTMRNQSFIVASIAALLMFGASTSAQAQQQSAPVPDAPQPQKKPAAKPAPTDSSSPADGKTDSKDDNAF